MINDVNIKKSKFLYEIYTENLRWNYFCLDFNNSQKKSDTKIIKIHVKIWFTYFLCLNNCKKWYKYKKKLKIYMKHILKFCVETLYVMVLMIHKKNLIRKY